MFSTSCCDEFKNADNDKTNVCAADARVTKSSIKSTPMRLLGLNKGTQHRQVRFEPEMTTPRQITKSTTRKYSSPSPLPTYTRVAPQPSRSPTIIEGGEIQEEDDNNETHLPRTFPMRDVKSPTLVTTYLGEPPNGELPPPPYKPPSQRRTP